MAFTDTAFALLDSNRYDDPPMDDDLPPSSEQVLRLRIAQTLRGLRRQPKCSVTSDLIAEWKRKADEMMCYRRADVKEK